VRRGCWLAGGGVHCLRGHRLTRVSGAEAAAAGDGGTMYGYAVTWVDHGCVSGVGTVCRGACMDYCCLGYAMCVPAETAWIDFNTLAAIRLLGVGREHRYGSCTPRVLLGGRPNTT
jgi:hypothetical protein